MKGSLFLGLCLSYGLTAFAADGSNLNFQGAIPQPAGQIEESITQFRVRFPSTMIKKDAFKVECSPKIDGFGSWADNDTLWTYNFKAKSEEDTPKLVGGAKCDVVQIADVASADNAKVWKAGTIKYSIQVAGPKVTNVIVANDFNGSLRESQATVMIMFDGPVNKSYFFSHQNAYLSYLSSNAPSEKIPLAPVPASEEATLFAYFKSTSYIDATVKDQTWILATVKQNLIPGSSVMLHVENQVSALNPTVHADKPYTQNLTVRGRFEAKVNCQNPSSSNSVCLPNSPIDIQLTGRVKWPDIKDAYIEYIPFKSKDRKVVRTYPEVPKQDTDPWSFNSIMNKVGQYVPYAAKFSDTLVDSVSFNVNIEPQTQAKVVIPSQLKDIDGRKLTNPIAEFKLRIGSMSEAIQLPQAVSFFEKNVSTLYMSAGVVNLNQKIVVRKTGSDKNRWEPITDIKTMIRVLRAYEIRGDSRTSPTYVSPLESLGLASNTAEEQLKGAKNRDIFLQFPFGTKAGGQVGGFYPIEISSPTLDAAKSDPKNGSWANPQYVLGQVTNLAVHMKKGMTNSIAWVTSLSDGKPVPNAQVEIYNCLGDLKKTVTTDASGLAYFENATWAQTCDVPENTYSDLFRPENIYIAAKAGGDQTLVHSSWLSSSSYVFSAPGVSYFYSNLQEGQPNFHSVIGVNLVKPGQKVPVEIFAKYPNARGFAEVNPAQLPAKVRVVSADDSNVFYEFPLKWENGAAAFTWTVPSDSSVKIGRYAIQLVGPGQSQPEMILPEDIEVAEFKVPLMSGVISFPNQPLVQPDSIPVSSVVRYANGVGAKNLGLEISYFFHPTSMEVKALPEFSFGTGPASLSDDDGSSTDGVLPTRNRPTTIESLKAGQDGSLTRDLGAEKVSDGRSIADVIKSLNRPQTMVVRVRYQDQMGEYQTLSKAKDIYNASKYVGTNLVSGDRTSAQLRAAMVDVNGNNLTSLDDLQLRVVRIESKIIGEEIFGGMVKNTVERELQPTRWESSNCQISKGVAVCAVGALKEGTYAFEATSKSAEQAAHVTFKVDGTGHVYGKDDYYQFGDQDGGKNLPLALDKDSYKDGDKAVVSFPAPFKNCSTLVSIERSDVIQAFVVNDACAKGNVQVPVDGSIAPNAFVSVFAVTGRAPMQQKAKLGDPDFGRPTYRLGFANMKVNWSRFKSDVTVTTDQPVYKPGDNVNVQVNVKASEGALTKGTVTLVAIEEKILELKKNETYNILDALMQLRGHSVETVTPLERIQTVVAKNADMPMPGAGRKGGNEGGDGSSKSEFKRKLFDALVLFQPNIPVVNGQASFTFKANDSVTKFKIFAITSDASQKFGTGSVEYVTQQDTQSYSNIPTVSHNGDNYPLLVTVQNNGQKPVNYTVRATMTVKDSSGKVIDTQTLSGQASIENAGSQAVNLGNIRISEDAASISYGVKIYDEKGNLVDSMEPPVQTIQPSVPLAVHDSFIYQMDKSNSFTRSLTKESDALANKGEIRASVAKSLVGGGLEQIVDRINRDTFSDFFLESRIYKAMLNSSPSNPGALSKVLAALIGYTDNNGFIKYFPENRTGSLWLTATILNNLQTESWTMSLMPAAVKQKLQTAVTTVLNSSVDPSYLGGTPSPMDWFRARVAFARAAYAFDNKELRDSASAVYKFYSAQLRGNPAALGATVDKWSNEDLLNYWLLEVAASPSTAKTSATYSQLTQASRLVYTGNMAQISGTPSYSFFYSDETIAAGQLLYGHAALKMDANLARALAEGLINKSNGGWYVNETLISVAEGLRAFAKAYETESVSGSATIQVPDEHASTSVNWDQADVGALVSPWTTPKAAVQVNQTGEGRPWVAVQALSATPLKAPRGQGLSVDKTVRNISRDAGFQTGDIIEVTLNLNASSAVNHVAVNDPIPAGANILADGFGGFDSGEKSYSGYKFYFGQLPQGLTTVKYQYQLNNPGTFNMPPTRAEGLYMPGVYGEAPNAALTVQ